MRSSHLMIFAISFAMTVIGCGRSPRALGGSPKPSSSAGVIVATLTGLLPTDRDLTWFEFILDCGAGLGGTGKRDTAAAAFTTTFEGTNIADGTVCVVRVTGTPPAAAADSMVPRDGAFYVSGEAKVTARKLNAALTQTYSDKAGPKEEPNPADGEAVDVIVSAGGACQEFDDSDYHCSKP